MKIKVKNFSSAVWPVVHGSLILLFIFLFSCSPGKRLPVVVMETALGKIIAEIDTVSAPVTGKNFLSLVERGIYNNACFYRVVRMDNQPDNTVKIEVVQGGLKTDSLIEAYTPIIHENTRMTGLKHIDGTVSMARNKPGSASTEFFICIGNQPELDFGGKRNPDGQGFAAFGRVKEGMSVVKKIQGFSDRNQYLINPLILTISRLE